MINFSRLILPKFIFNPILSPISEKFVRTFCVLFGLCLIFGLASKLITIKQTRDKNLPLTKLWQKLTTYFATIGIIGFLLLFFRQQRVYFLSMPLFWYLLFISGLVWLWFIVKWIKIKMKKMEKEIEEKKKKERYLQ